MCLRPPSKARRRVSPSPSCGRMVWSEGFGFANREHKIAATPDTPFSLASITKPFTATLVVSLAAQRLLSLHAPAMPYLKSTPLQGPNGDPDGPEKRALLERLLWHCQILAGSSTQGRHSEGKRDEGSRFMRLLDYGANLKTIPQTSNSDSTMTSDFIAASPPPPAAA